MSSDESRSQRRRIQRKVSARIDSLFRDAPRTTTDDTDDDASNKCQPWSHADFAARVESFTPLRWFAKPPSASPLVCAAHGWHCSAANRVACAACRASLDVLDGDASSVDEATLVQLQGAAHAPRCPWRELACPARFAQAPMHADGMRLQYREALPRLFALARVPAVAPDVVATHVRLLRKLPLYANLDCADSARCDALRCLAIHGWTATPDARALLCELCRRRVAVDSLVALDELESELSPERRAAPLFDPLNEHRAFCPWSQGAVDGMLRAFNHRPAEAAVAPQSGTKRSGDDGETLATLRAVRRALSSV